MAFVNNFEDGIENVSCYGMNNAL